MSTWELTEHPKIQVCDQRPGGYQVRWEKPVPKTRIRCPKYQKDLVVMLRGNPGDIRKHTCKRATPERGYLYAHKAGSLRLFGTRSQAIAVAMEAMGLTVIPEQIASRAMMQLADAYGQPGRIVEL